MGCTLKLLAERELPDRVKPSGNLLVDLCENVHIHARDLRQEFTVAEFVEYVHHVTEAAEGIRSYLDNHEYSEGVHHKAVWKLGPTPVWKSPEPHISAYFPRRLRIELEKPHDMGEVHLHWRDFRLHLSLEELRLLASAASEAVETLETYLAEHDYRPRGKS